MEEKQIISYRKIVTLKDGVNVLLRPMTRDNAQELIDLFSPVTDEDLRYLRHNVRDKKLINSWCKDLDYSRVLPVIALVNKRAIGQATLHFEKGPRRHLAEMRIYLAVDYRRRGLGNIMLHTMIELARKHDLNMLVAEIVADQSHVVKAFQNAGFELRCSLEDYFMLPDGDKRDVAVLTLNLRASVDEF